MNDAKYIGLDVHQATICAAVVDSAGNLVMEAILETKTETIGSSPQLRSLEPILTSVPAQKQLMLLKKCVTGEPGC